MQWELEACLWSQTWVAGDKIQWAKTRRGHCWGWEAKPTWTEGEYDTHFLTSAIDGVAFEWPNTAYAVLIFQNTGWPWVSYLCKKFPAKYSARMSPGSAMYDCETEFCGHAAFTAVFVCFLSPLVSYLSCVSWNPKEFFFTPVLILYLDTNTWLLTQPSNQSSPRA